MYYKSLWEVVVMGEIVVQEVVILQVVVGRDCSTQQQKMKVCQTQDGEGELVWSFNLWRKRRPIYVVARDAG